MEMRIAVKVDVVQVLEITQCLHRQDVDAQLSGSRAWLQDRYLPVDWPILLKYHPELQKGEPLRLWVPTCAGDRPQGTPSADCDLTADEVLEIMQALWNWDGPASGVPPLESGVCGAVVGDGAGAGGSGGVHRPLNDCRAQRVHPPDGKADAAARGGKTCSPGRGSGTGGAEGSAWGAVPWKKAG
ncbi:MAG: hypothetical protein LKE51_09485 [Selenomonas sp.]|nr:hypothetical protein [Selenomonas sp.]